MEKFVNGPCNIDDEVIVVGFAPVVFAAVTELKGEGDVFGDGPGGPDIGAVKEALLEIVDDVGGDEERWVAEVTGGVEAWEGLVELCRS